MVEWSVVLLLAVLGVVGSGFYSGAETGLYCVNRLRVFLGVQQEDRRAKRLARLIEDEQGTLAVTLIGTNLTDYLGATAVAYMFGSLLRFSDFDVELYTVAVVTPLVFVFGEVVPKNVFRLHADALMPRFAGMLAWSVRVFGALGLVWALKSINSLVARCFWVAGADHRLATPKHRVAAMLQEALAEHDYGQDQSDLIERACRLSETPVRSVMIPYHRVTMIAADANRETLYQLARTTRYARVLVHGPRRSQVVGLVKIDELLRSQEWLTVGEQVTPVITLRPLDTVAAAIGRMQKVRREMAIVAGANGGLLGVVTLRDLLDEVAGEVAFADAA